MAVTKKQRKTTSTRRNVASKKIKPKRGSLEAIEESVKFAHKHKLDFNYIKECQIG